MNNKLSVGRIISIVLSLLSVICAAVFFIFNGMLPAPLAEVISFIKSFFVGGNIIFGIILSVIYLATLFVTVLTAFEPYGKKLWLFLPASLVYLCDTFIHVYAFLCQPGYSWGKLISSLFDIFIICVLISKNGKDNTANNDDEGFGKKVIDAPDDDIVDEEDDAFSEKKG